MEKTEILYILTHCILLINNKHLCRFKLIYFPFCHSVNYFFLNLSELVAELVERVDANEHLKDHIFKLRCKI